MNIWVGAGENDIAELKTNEESFVKSNVPDFIFNILYFACFKVCMNLKTREYEWKSPYRKRKHPIS